MSDGSDGRRQFSFLANARKEVARRGLDAIPVVDCDCHVYETTAMPEIAAYVQNPAVRRPFERYTQSMLMHAFLPGNLGDRMVAGRIKTDLDQVLPAGEFEGMHTIAAGLLNSMNQMAIDYSILFPTPMLTLGTHPQLEVEVDLARVQPLAGRARAARQPADQDHGVPAPERPGRERPVHRGVR